MQKTTGFSMRVFFRVFFASVVLMLFILSAGCKKEAAEPKEIVEILKVSPECMADNESVEACCLSECRDFCSKNQMEYQKHVTNIVHCGCWCGE